MVVLWMGGRAGMLWMHAAVAGREARSETKYSKSLAPWGSVLIRTAMAKTAGTIKGGGD